jgi:hypothetical protein
MHGGITTLLSGIGFTAQFMIAETPSMSLSTTGGCSGHEKHENR